MWPLAALTRTLPAERPAIDRLCRDLGVSVLAGLPAEEKFVIELLLREALTNAVIHGARNQPESLVECEVRPLPGGIKIRVADQGPGFDWRGWLANPPQPKCESGRGLHILHLYATEVRFLGAGNEVEVIRMFSRGGQNGM